MAQTPPPTQAAQPVHPLLVRLRTYMNPLILLFISLTMLPKVLLLHPLLLLTSPKAFQSAWFSSLWTYIGPQMALAPDQVPYIANLFSRAKGTVLEIGPGSGEQMRHLIKPVQSGKVKRMVAAEPTVGLHERLIMNAKGIGLDPQKGQFTVLSAGAEPASLIPALHKAGLCPTDAAREGTFDTIITVKSLCSVPQDQMRSILGTIHTLLKPGGEFLFFEHVANDTDYITMAWTWLLSWVWSTAMGNCHIRANMDTVLREMGSEWEVMDFGNTKEFTGVECFRHVTGVCRKAKR